MFPGPLVGHVCYPSRKITRRLTRTACKILWGAVRQVVRYSDGRTSDIVPQRDAHGRAAHGSIRRAGCAVSASAAKIGRGREVPVGGGVWSHVRWRRSGRTVDPGRRVGRPGRTGFGLGEEKTSCGIFRPHASRTACHQPIGRTCSAGRLLHRLRTHLERLRRGSFSMDQESTITALLRHRPRAEREAEGQAGTGRPAPTPTPTLNGTMRHQRGRDRHD